LKGHPELLTDLQVNPGETNNYINDLNYTEVKERLKKELQKNLEKRGLWPLSENRTIEELRAIEKENREKTGKKKDTDE
jgi:hypothetical protein